MQLSLNPEDFQRRGYSQFGEDMLIECLFPTANDKSYVDLGCFHPWQLSNTARLYERGWRGLNIDANPECVRLFKTARPEDITLNFAIGDAQGQDLEMFIFDGHESCNTCSRSQAESLARLWSVPVPEPIRVPSISLETIFDKYAPADVALLNVDLEALDLMCLKSGNWTKHRPLVVLAEDGEFLFARPYESAIFSFMTSVGYTMYSRCHATSFFVRSEDFGRCQHGGPLELRRTWVKRWSRLFEQILRVDKWSSAGFRLPSGAAAG